MDKEIEDEFKQVYQRMISLESRLQKILQMLGKIIEHEELHTKKHTGEVYND